MNPVAALLVGLRKWWFRYPTCPRCHMGDQKLVGYSTHDRRTWEQWLCRDCGYAREVPWRHPYD